MPTDNPKISLYVPQQIYNRFKEFQQQQDLSMSQAGIVILAEYFGIQETIKEITEGTTIGGVTLARIEKIEKEILELREKVDYSNSTSKLPKNSELKEETISEPLETEFSDIQGIETTEGDSKKIQLKKFDNQSVELYLTPAKDIEPIMGKLLAQRLNISKSVLSAYKSKNSLEEFSQWTQEKDPDSIAWTLASNNKKYIPKNELSSELLSKLQEWIDQNS